MWSSLCVVFLGFSAWAVSWLPVLPTLLHPSPAVLLLHLVWRCHRVSGCPLCLQSYHQQERTLGSSRRQEPICPTLERLTSVTANAKVNVSFSFCKTKVFLNVSNSRFFYAEVFPIQMEGVRLTVNKGLSNHFQVSQCVSSTHSHVSVQLIWPFFCFCSGESHLDAEHHGRLQLQVWNHVRGVQADGSSRGGLGHWFSLHLYIYQSVGFKFVVFSFFQLWLETWTTAAAWTLRSSIRSAAGYDPNSPSRWWHYYRQQLTLTCLPYLLSLMGYT